MSQTSLTLSLQQIQLLRTLAIKHRDEVAEPALLAAERAVRQYRIGEAASDPSTTAESTSAAIAHEVARRKHHIVTQTIGTLGRARDRAIERSKKEQQREH